jgi:hypothetical protein
MNFLLLRESLSLRGVSGVLFLSGFWFLRDILVLLLKSHFSPARLVSEAVKILSRKSVLLNLCRDRFCLFRNLCRDRFCLFRSGFSG